RARGHPAQSRWRTTQKMRSARRSRGRALERRATASCWRSAAFSRIRVALGITMARPRARQTERSVGIGAGRYHAEIAVLVGRYGFSRTTAVEALDEGV